MPLLVLLPATWTSHSPADLWILGAVEAALLLFLLTLWDPRRFHASGLGLLGLALGGILLAGVLLEGVGTGPLTWVAMVAFSAACTYYALTGSFERRPSPATASPPEAGEVHLEGSLLHYTSNESHWVLHPDEVLVVGELTTDSPDDDHCLCFLTDLDGAWRRVPFRARGREELLAWLRAELGCSFRFELRDASRFASRCLWPEALAGEPFFVRGDLVQTEPLVLAPGVLDELRRRAG